MATPDRCLGQATDRVKLMVREGTPMSSTEPAEKMQRKVYEKELGKLQKELCHLQDWIRKSGARVIVVLEGRDAAGKGGTIKAITERVSPRVFRIVALPAPSDREKSQMYMQRYLKRFPAGGEIYILTGAGTTAPASNTSWASARPSSTSTFSNSVRSSRSSSSITGRC